MPFEEGQNVGPYRIVKKLGQGGMATVYKAYHPALDRFVAIKVLHPAFMQDPNFLERFKREARVVARLDHANIVPIYDFAEHAGQPYLVMKFIQGETLKARLQRGPVGAEEGVGILRSVAAALSYAHNRGILHRDVKPSNVMLSEEGPVYLTDFGLARIADAGESTLSGDMLLGTPHYISPEQAKGGKELDHRTDIYSFGILLYELVVGRVPFNADTPFSIIHDHIFTPLPLPSEVNREVPDAVQTVLLKALAKEPEDRFEDVDQLAQAFMQALEEPLPTSGASATVIEAQQPSTVMTDVEVFEVDAGAEERASSADSPKQAKSSAKRGPNWIWLASGLTIVCLVLAGVLVFLNRPAIRAFFAADQASSTESQIEDGGNQALDRARQVAADNPQDPGAHLELAFRLQEFGYENEAVASFARAGDLFMRGGMPLEAVMAYSSAIEMLGGPIEADRGLSEPFGEALFISASHEEAWPTLESMYAMFPEWRMLPILEARLLLHSGDRLEAVKTIDRVLKGEAENPVALVVKAEILMSMGQLEEAEMILHHAREQPPMLPWLHEHMDLLQEEIRRLQE